MISKARNQILGEYFLNWFIIKCNVDIDFENLSNSDTHNQLGTFFHEYIHFLQNASTTYGNMNETVSIPQLSWGNNRCKWR